jgi:antitoxin component YwqK of YwqJK toxin-antitoxin module
MIRIVLANLTIVVLFSSSFSAGPYLLQSRILTNFGSSSPQRLTTYSYDNHGDSVKVTAFLGSDTLSTVDNSIMYGYDSRQRLISELHLLAGVDTTALIYYSYDTNGNLSVIRTMVTGGKWQTDSLKYDSNQRLVQKWHYATISDYHLYSYNASGQEVADTLFELFAAAFVPTQASIFDYSISNTITQKGYSFSGGIGNLWQSSITKYSNDRILSIAQYQNNGLSEIFVDSMTFAYDTLGNKTRVSHFSNKGERISTIDYQWMPNPYDAILVRGAPEKKNIEIAYSKRTVTIRHSESAAGYLAVFALDGRLVKKETVMTGQNHSMALPGIARGKFIAVYMAGSMKQSLLFSIEN